ncbi:MAG: tRNA (adenosine(37)-N6)-threonylcarbamoyltransferase complex dimerization subunit type 1 TsaB [Nitrospirota bacterium]
MKILALETATLAGGAAIVDDSSGLIGEVRIDVKAAHSERLMPSVEWLLRASNLTIHDIDAFAVSIGPGSFTGLRIGLSTVKGLAYATGMPIVPVPTLDAFARAFPFSRYTICPMLDARRNEIYTALYRWEDGECRKIMPETAIAPADFLKGITEKIVLAGDGTGTYRQLIIDTLKSNALFAPYSRMSPSAVHVAEEAIEKIRQGITADPVTLIPYYIRKSEAELNWKG